MKLRKLPNKTETFTVIKRSMSVDGVRIELPSDMCSLFEDLNDTTYPTDLIRIYDRELVKALMDCGFIRNGSRGSRTDAVFAGDKYYATDRFRKHYPQLTKKVLSILYDKLGEKEDDSS